MSGGYGAAAHKGIRVWIREDLQDREKRLHVVVEKAHRFHASWYVDKETATALMMALMSYEDGDDDDGNSGAPANAIPPAFVFRKPEGDEPKVYA